MRRVLWLCNLVLPDFSQEFKIKKNPYGGWMTGMLHELEGESSLDIALCFPIMDESRLKNGNRNGHRYYTFLFEEDAVSYTEKMVSSFEKIVREEKPDIIHIWGTEYPHTAAMVEACERQGLLDRIVINIQGLVSVCADHYLSGIPEQYRLTCQDGVNMEDGVRMFQEKGRYEIESIRKVSHVMGRTDWDRACVEAIHPGIQYHFCKEILKDIFYENAGKWKEKSCRRHSIFVSQASYPVKGFHYFLRALPIVINQFPDTRVYVAGRKLENDSRDPYATYIADMMEEYKVKDYITFVGKLDGEQMLRQYLDANVFVSPSTIENSSNSVCEAIMLGVPVIASYVGGTGNLVVHGRQGFLYPYDEPAMLAYYINTVFRGNWRDRQENVNNISGLNSKSDSRQQLLNCYDSIR